MASYKDTDIVGGRIKIGNTTYNMTEIRYGSQLALVWPQNYAISYVIVQNTLSVGYYDGSTLTGNEFILANGFGKFAARANVQEYHGETLYQTLTNVFLTPRSIASGTYSNKFSINGQTIQGSNLGTTRVNTGTTSNPAGYYADVVFGYGPAGTDSTTVTATVNQQYNLPLVQSTDKEYVGFSYGLVSDTFTSGGGTVSGASRPPSSRGVPRLAISACRDVRAEDPTPRGLPPRSRSARASSPS